MTLDDFLKYVLPEVPGCPTVTAKQAVLDAADEFLTFTGAWDEVQDAIPLLADVQEYELEAPTGARCIDLKAVYTRAGQLEGVTIRQLAVLLPNWQSAEASHPSHYTRAFDFSNIRVYPLPTAPDGETIAMHAVYTVTDRATTIPDVIVQRYREPIAAGAKARLQRMSPKVATWADARAAKERQDEFEDGKLAARVTANHSKTTGALYVPARAFGQ
jgi:hypothetical protein